MPRAPRPPDKRTLVVSIDCNNQEQVSASTLLWVNKISGKYVEQAYVLNDRPCYYREDGARLYWDDGRKNRRGWWIHDTKFAVYAHHHGDDMDVPEGGWRCPGKWNIYVGIDLKIRIKAAKPRRKETSCMQGMCGMFSQLRDRCKVPDCIGNCQAFVNDPENQEWAKSKCEAGVVAAGTEFREFAQSNCAAGLAAAGKRCCSICSGALAAAGKAGCASCTYDIADLVIEFCQDGEPVAEFQPDEAATAAPSLGGRPDVQEIVGAAPSPLCRVDVQEMFVQQAEKRAEKAKATLADAQRDFDMARLELEEERAKLVEIRAGLLAPSLQAIEDVAMSPNDALKTLQDQLASAMAQVAQLTEERNSLRTAPFQELFGQPADLTWDIKAVPQPQGPRLCLLDTHLPQSSGASTNEGQQSSRASATEHAVDLDLDLGGAAGAASSALPEAAVAAVRCKAEATVGAVGCMTRAPKLPEALLREVVDEIYATGLDLAQKHSLAHFAIGMRMGNPVGLESPLSLDCLEGACAAVTYVATQPSELKVGTAQRWPCKSHGAVGKGLDFDDVFIDDILATPDADWDCATASTTGSSVAADEDEDLKRYLAGPIGALDVDWTDRRRRKGGDGDMMDFMFDADVRDMLGDTLDVRDMMAVRESLGSTFEVFNMASYDDADAADDDADVADDKADDADDRDELNAVSLGLAASQVEDGNIKALAAEFEALQDQVDGLQSELHVALANADQFAIESMHFQEENRHLNLVGSRQAARFEHYVSMMGGKLLGDPEDSWHTKIDCGLDIMMDGQLQVCR